MCKQGIHFMNPMQRPNPILHASMVMGWHVGVCVCSDSGWWGGCVGLMVLAVRRAYCSR